MTPLIRYFIWLGAGLAGSGLLVAGSKALNKADSQRVIKDEIFRNTLEDIQQDFDIIREGNPHDAVAMANQLLSFLRLYGKENKSQKEYLKPHVDRLNQVKNTDIKYSQKMTLLRKTIKELLSYIDK